MKRGDVVQLGQHRLMCGDAADIQSLLSGVRFDALITDPPFGIGFKYSTHDDSPEGYGEWLWGIIESYESLCAPGSPVFVWQAMPNVRQFSAWFPREWRIFAAAKNFVQMRKVTMQYSFDPVVTWWTPGETWTEATANRDFHIANTSPSSRKKGSLAYVDGHPCPRPLGQIEHVLTQWVKPNGLIVDPFAGSGTTLIAAETTGRRCYAVEIDPTYCDVIVQRYGSTKQQQRLPMTVTPPPCNGSDVGE